MTSATPGAQARPEPSAPSTIVSITDMPDTAPAAPGSVHALILDQLDESSLKAAEGWAPESAQTSICIKLPGGLNCSTGSPWWAVSITVFQIGAAPP